MHQIYMYLVCCLICTHVYCLGVYIYIYIYSLNVQSSHLMYSTSKFPTLISYISLPIIHIQPADSIFSMQLIVLVKSMYLSLLAITGICSHRMSFCFICVFLYWNVRPCCSILILKCKAIQSWMVVLNHTNSQLIWFSTLQATHQKHHCWPIVGTDSYVMKGRVPVVINRTSDVITIQSSHDTNQLKVHMDTSELDHRQIQYLLNDVSLIPTLTLTKLTDMN